MFRDAGAPKEVLQMCKDFQCEACSHKGGKAPARPAIPTPVTTKWQCLSVDTFWWRTPHEGENKKSCVGVSFMDEATDYHTAIIVRQGSGGDSEQYQLGGVQKGIHGMLAQVASNT